jgi:spermidine synthase
VATTANATAGAGARAPLWATVIFCASGFAALIYQVVWQRVLFATFGVNIEAVTTIVTAFLAGLGVGSLLGGRFAEGSDRALLLWFGSIETAVGLFGLVSLPFFHAVGELTLGLNSVPRGIVMAVVVMLPTTLMGATLPLLAGYLVRVNANVGRTVGLLYFVNTAGSALAALAAVLLLLGNLGETRSVMLAAAVNLTCGLIILAGPGARVRSR